MQGSGSPSVRRGDGDHGGWFVPRAPCPVPGRGPACRCPTFRWPVGRVSRRVQPSVVSYPAVAPNDVWSHTASELPPPAEVRRVATAMERPSRWGLPSFRGGLSGTGGCGSGAWPPSAVPPRPRTVVVVEETPLSRHLAAGKVPRRSLMDAFDLARQRYLAGDRVDMQDLAGSLGISRAVLFPWVGNRDQLIAHGAGPGAGCGRGAGPGRIPHRRHRGELHPRHHRGRLRPHLRVPRAQGGPPTDDHQGRRRAAPHRREDPGSLQEEVDRGARVPPMELPDLACIVTRIGDVRTPGPDQRRRTRRGRTGGRRCRPAALSRPLVAGDVSLGSVLAAAHFPPRKAQGLRIMNG